MTHKTISEKSIAVMSDLLIDYFNDGNPIEKSSDLDGILTIFAMAGTNLEIDARQSAAAEMRARCAARIRELMAEWGTTGSYFEFGAQLHNAIDQLPLDAPEAKGNQHE